MEGILDAIQNNFPLIVEHRYLFIFIGAVIESLNTLILAGFLASIGAVSFWPIILICLAGEFLNGMMWYSVGYFGGAKPIDRWGRKDARSRRIIETVENYFHRYSGRAIILTKLTWSLTIATMIMAGSLKYDLKKMALYNLIGSIGWLAITFTVGYVFGQSYQALFIVHNVAYVFLFLIVALMLIYFMKVFFRSAFIKSLLAKEGLKKATDIVKDGIDRMMQK